MQSSCTVDSIGQFPTEDIHFTSEVGGYWLNEGKTLPQMTPLQEDVARDHKSPKLCDRDGLNAREQKNY